MRRLTGRVPRTRLVACTPPAANLTDSIPSSAAANVTAPHQHRKCGPVPRPQAERGRIGAMPEKPELGTDASDHAPVQGELFAEHDLGAAEYSVGHRGLGVSKIVGISYRQLDYWARTGLVVPTLRAARGSGS